jgi:hypothetical protein
MRCGTICHLRHCRPARPPSDGGRYRLCLRRKHCLGLRSPGKAAVEGTLSAEDPRRGKSYRVEPGRLPFFMHRERGLYLDEHDLTVDGRRKTGSPMTAAAPHPEIPKRRYTKMRRGGMLPHVFLPGRQALVAVEQIDALL